MMIYRINAHIDAIHICLIPQLSYGRSSTTEISSRSPRGSKLDMPILSWNSLARGTPVVLTILSHTMAYVGLVASVIGPFWVGSLRCLVTDNESLTNPAVYKLAMLVKVSSQESNQASYSSCPSLEIASLFEDIFNTLLFDVVWNGLWINWS